MVRKIGPALVAAGLCVAILGSGCGPRTNPSNSGASSSAASSNSAVPVVPGTKPADARSSAQNFARDFLIALKEGKASPDLLTVEFKKVIAEPVFEAEKAEGFSNTTSAAWLARLGNTVMSSEVKVESVGTPLTYAVAATTDGKRALLRLAPSGTSWKIDWYQPALAGTPTFPLTGTEADVGRRFTACAWIEALMGQEQDKAEGLLTSSLKGKLAPPFKSDMARGYSRSILKSRFAEYVQGATAYTLDAVSNGKATLILTTRSGTRKLILSLVPGPRAGEFLIDQLDTTP